MWRLPSKGRVCSFPLISESSSLWLLPLRCHLGCPKRQHVPSGLLSSALAFVAHAAATTILLRLDHRSSSPNADVAKGLALVESTYELEISNST